jgi:hypothetical protein
VTPVQRQLLDTLPFDDSAQRRLFCPHARDLALDGYRFTQLPDLQRDVEPQTLRHFENNIGTAECFESWRCRSHFELAHRKQRHHITTVRRTLRPEIEVGRHLSDDDVHARHAAALHVRDRPRKCSLWRL